MSRAVGLAIARCFRRASRGCLTGPGGGHLGDESVAAPSLECRCFVTYDSNADLDENLVTACFAELLSNPTN